MRTEHPTTLQVQLGGRWFAWMQMLLEAIARAGFQEVMLTFQILFLYDYILTEIKARVFLVVKEKSLNCLLLKIFLDYGEQFFYFYFRPLHTKIEFCSGCREQNWGNCHWLFLYKITKKVCYAHTFKHWIDEHIGRGFKVKMEYSTTNPCIISHDTVMSRSIYYIIYMI